MENKMRKPLFIVTKFASALKRDFDAVVKSEKRVPTPITTSASFAITLAERLPVTPTPPTPTPSP